LFSDIDLFFNSLPTHFFIFLHIPSFPFTYESIPRRMIDIHASSAMENGNSVDMKIIPMSIYRCMVLDWSLKCSKFQIAKTKRQ